MTTPKQSLPPIWLGGANAVTPYPRTRRSKSLRPAFDSSLLHSDVDARFAALTASATATNGRAWAQKYQSRLRITDALVVVAVAALTSVIHSGLSFGSTQLSAQQIGEFALAAVIALIWVAALAAFHTRDPRVIGVGSAEYKRVAAASLTTFGVLAFAVIVLRISVARELFSLALPLGIVALLLTRWLWRKWLNQQRAFGHYLSRAIVVGEREDVEYVIAQVNANSGAAYCIVGAALNSTSSGDLTVGEQRVPVISSLNGAAAAAGHLGADTVIVAGHPRGGSSFIRDLAWKLEETNAELVLSSRLTDVAGPRIHFRPVEGLPLIHVEIPHYEGGKHVMKRGLDVVASALGLLFLAPLLLAIGLLVRLDSPGPALYKQERCGRNGESFQMLKFRSMSTDADERLQALREQNEGSGLLFKIKNDPRVTRLGRILRNYSLDELPQLWNVLRGDMSLVGPRPPLPTEVNQYEAHVHRRLYIKPGLTGMWQVNGRSDLNWDESVRLDLYYVENWSLMGDLVILWRTVRVLAHPTGAY